MNGKVQKLKHPIKTIRLCPNCAAPLPPDAPDGLCPQCLLKSDPSSPSAGADSKARTEAALLFRRGLGHRLLRVEIVTKMGLPARRWRTFLRCLLAWLPCLLLLLSSIVTDSYWTPLIFVLIVLGGIAYRLVRPGRAIRDRLAGTWLVPE